MLKKFFASLFLIIIAAVLWFLNYQYEREFIHKFFLTAVSIAISYIIFKVAFETGLRKIKEFKTRYSIKKAFSVLFVLAISASVIAIWIESTQSLLVSYGLFAAGATIALQDIFKNFMGGLLVLFMGIYRVGDRIELKDKIGDVLDINLLYTTMLELDNWMSGEKPTGRITTVPNGYVLYNPVNNHTKDHNFVWDEVKIPITYDSNWKKAITIFSKEAKRETEEISEKADKQIRRLRRKYYFIQRPTKPIVYVFTTDNWIELTVRYTVEAKSKSDFRDRIMRRILNKVQEEKDIKISSQTLQVLPPASEKGR